MEIIIEICNNCGKKLLPTGELINMKVVHTNQDNKRKEESIKVCWECYGHVLKYPTEKVDNGNSPHQDFGTYDKKKANKLTESFDEFLNEDSI